jgi:hypothetical protein
VLDRRSAAFRKDLYQEVKRYMLVSVKPMADFSRGCAHPAMRPPISATHPPTRKNRSPGNGTPARLRHSHSSQKAAEQDTPNGQAEKPASAKRSGAGKARKSQVDLLKTLAVEWRGENGVERLENRPGNPLTDMTRALVLNVISIVISGVSSGPP